MALNYDENLDLGDDFSRALTKHAKTRYQYYREQGFNDEQAWTNVRFEIKQSIRELESRPQVHTVVWGAFWKAGQVGAKVAGKVLGKLGKQASQKIAKKAVEETGKYSKETQRLIGKTDKSFKKELLERTGKGKSESTLRAAQKELKGEQIPLAKQRGRTYDHIEKVKSAQRGIIKHIQDIKNRLGFTELPRIERQVLQQELSNASKLLDHTNKFVPRT